MNWFIVHCAYAILLSLNARISCIHENDLTQICFKEGADLSANDSWIIRNGSTFHELIQYGVFVDKSLLLENIFLQPTLVSIILGPHKWGKSVNLDMIEFFAGIQRFSNGDRKPKEDTTAYKYFVKGEVLLCSGIVRKLQNPPLISHRKHFIEENLANFAIIRLSLDGLPEFGTEHSEFGSFYRYFVTKIHGVFMKYKFILYKLRYIVEEASNNTGPVTKIVEFARRDYQQFKSIVYGRTKEPEMLDSISFLCHVISYYLHENVLILIDNYDDVINQMFYEPKTNYMLIKGKQIQSYIFNFLGFAVKGNRFITRGVIAGTMKLIRAFNGVGLEDYRVYNVPDDLRPFYGFTEHEVQQLFKLRGMNEKDGKIATQYYQYYTISHPERIFNPQVILKFLSDCKRGNYWSGDSTIVNNTLTQLLRFYPFKTVIESLLNINSYRSIRKEFLKISDWQYEVAELIRCKFSSLIKDKQVDGILSWLYSLGYLSAKPSQQPDIIHISIANGEVRDYIGSQMKSFYTKLLGEHLQFLIDFGNSLMGFLENDDKTSEKFQHDMLTLLENKSMHDNFKKELEHGQGSLMTEILHSWNCSHTRVAAARSLIRKVLTLLQIDNKLEVEMSQNCRLPNTEAHQIVFLASHQERAVIIELVGNPTTIEQTLNQVINYTLLIKEQMARFDVVKYVAVNVPSKGPIELATTAKRIEEIEVFILSNS